MKGVLGLGLFLAVAASSDDTRNPSSVAADEEPKGAPAAPQTF